MEVEKMFFMVFKIKVKVYARCITGICVHPVEQCPEYCKKCEYFAPYKIDYPKITDAILLDLIAIVGEEGYRTEISREPYHNNLDEFFIAISKKQKRYHAHDKYFDKAPIKAICLLDKTEKITKEIQELFNN